jgi:ABC-2 type transport system permease protein
MSIIMSIFSVVAQAAVWIFIFRNESGMISYMISYVVLAQVISIPLKNTITELITEKITSGAFVTDLIKPVNPTLMFTSTASGNVLAELFSKGIFLVLVSIPFIELQPGFERYLLFLLVMILAFVIGNLIFIMIGYFAFVVFETWPYIRLVNDTIRLLAGGVIPLAFFPGWLADISYLFPFHYMYSFPIRLLLEDLPASEITNNLLMMTLWILFLGGLLVLVYRAAIKRCVIQGG